jgi:hypothetical protein
LGARGLINDENPQQFIHFYEAYSLADLRPVVFEMAEFVGENDLDAGTSEDMKLQLLLWLRQIDDRIDPIPEDGKPKQAERFHRVKRAGEDAVLIHLGFQHIDLSEQRLKTEHVDRFGKMVVDFVTFAIDKDV